MSGFDCSAPLAVTEGVLLQAAVDDMSLLGVSAMLVVRNQIVVGVVAAGRRRNGSGSAAGEPTSSVHVADVMLPVIEVPAIDWHTLQEAFVSDLLEIFEGAGIDYLVVLDTEKPGQSRVRGMIHRGRLLRQLQA